MLMINQCTSALRRAARTLTVVGFLVSAACTSLGPSTRPPMADSAALEQRARDAVAAGNLPAAADLYTQLAAMANGASRAGFLLEAARLAADYGDTALARRRIAEARGGTTLPQQQLSAVLSARLELLEGRPQAALDMLSTLPQALPEDLQSEAAAIRGQALFRVGRPVEGVRALVDREIWLSDAAAVRANQRMIWDGFRQYPPPPQALTTGDPIVDGWLALAPLSSVTGPELRRALLVWRQTYTSHPAAGGLLAELLAAERVSSFPSQIALLLPMSAPERAAALALRDGFMAAHLRDPASTQTRVRIYDTAALGSAEAYLRAQIDGADFIVGPLLQPEVDEVIAQAGFVPTLALNFASLPSTFSGSFYQYALSSEDEARTIAAAAIASGARTALAFVPSNPRGLQIRDNFQAAFEAAGGEVVSWNSYEPALQDFSQPVAALLNANRSRDRYRRLAANLGVPVQFPEPRRREDVDMIFVAADARAGRLLAPQLRFFGAGNVPTYATAEIYDPASTARDNDLNGFVFADMPALVAPDADAMSARSDLQTYWPQRAALVRLYSMGFDAYRLVAPLYTEERGSWPMRGLTGDLSLDSEGRVRRVLPLARLQGGRPVAVEATGLPPIVSGGVIGAR
jgi:outer membrane PBP1 activator LpoA protein